MVTYEHAKVTKMTVVFIARDSVDIFKVYGETVANFAFYRFRQTKSLSVALSHLKSSKVAIFFVPILLESP